MPPRGVMDKVEAKGLFPGAEVVRGPDWAWEEQDGQFSKVYKQMDGSGVTEL